MDVSALGSSTTGRGDNLATSGAQRNEALADARRQARNAQLDAARAAQENRAVQFAETRDLIARAIGANTRLSISRSDASDIFVYRAIDRDSGEIVQEWPPQQFAEFVRQLIIAETGASPSEAAPGGVVDERA